MRADVRNPHRCARPRESCVEVQVQAYPRPDRFNFQEQIRSAITTLEASVAAIEKQNHEIRQAVTQQQQDMQLLGGKLDEILATLPTQPQGSENTQVNSTPEVSRKGGVEDDTAELDFKEKPEEFYTLCLDLAFAPGSSPVHTLKYTLGMVVLALTQVCRFRPMPLFPLLHPPRDAHGCLGPSKG